MLDLLNKESKSAVRNMCQELKEAISKELKESMIMMCHQIKNISTKIEVLWQPNRNSEVARTITGMKI